jgi:hypothetical protein
MKFKLLVCVLFVISGLKAQDFWQQIDSMNGPGKSVCGAFVLEDEGYVLGGLDDFAFKRKMYSYDMFQDDWDEEESIGGPNGDGLERGSATTFSIGNKGYVCLGQGQTVGYLGDLWEYDLETGAWTQKANFLGGPRKQAVSFVINGLAYVGTGQSASGLKKDFFKYDPVLNSWTQLNDFQGTARRQSVGFELAGNGWVGTGDDGVLKKDFWMYNPTSDTWIQKTDFPGTARAGAVGWSTYPTAFIATGEDVNFDYKKDVWEYNFFANAWVQRADLPGNGRKNAVAFVLNDIAFVGTGFSGIFEDDFYAYYGIAGLASNQLSFNSSVYPNPVQNLAYISIEDGVSSDLNIQLFSLSGQELTSELNSNVSGDKIHFDMSSFGNGYYIYRLTDKSTGRSSTGKISVLR